MNRGYGKIKSDHSIEYAPDMIRVNGKQIAWPDSAELYAAADDGPWLPIVDEPPTTPPREGYHWERTRPVKEGGEIRWQYAEVADPPLPPRTFRRSWLAQWMYANGKWDTFTEFIEDNAYSHLRFLWEICTEFDEDNLEWPTALAAIKTALQLTDAEAEAMLAFGATGGIAQ